MFSRFIEFIKSVKFKIKSNDPAKPVKVAVPPVPKEPEPIVPKDKMTVSSYILEIFENGAFVGGNDSYGRVTFIRGDRGRLTYGKHQASLTSGGLYEIVKNYVKENGHLANEIGPYLEPLKAQIVQVDSDHTLHRLLRRAGSDPVMRQVQDEFFLKNYTKPALRWFEEMGCELPLSFAIINDSITHGSWYDPSWGGMKKRTDDKYGFIYKIGEKKWMEKYVETRFEWLRDHTNLILRKTIYRPRFFKEEIARGNWNMELPIMVHGILVSKIIDHALQTSMTPTFTRFIKQKHPKMIGEDVYFIENGLVRAGLLRPSNLDAEFNSVDEQALIKYQRSRGLTVDGIAGLQTFEAMTKEFIR